MKKIIVLLLMVGLSVADSHAQAKQRKVLLLQIAALQTYIGYAKKGYTVVKKGLTFIGDVKKGELNLHSEYFSSLLKVNPKMRNYVKVAEIIALQIKMIKTYKKTVEQLQKDDLFHGDELDYIKRAFERLLENGDSILEGLLLITTDSTLELKDDQRIERIDRLHKTMLEMYGVCEQFSDEINLLSLSKGKENNDSKQSRGLHGL